MTKSEKRELAEKNKNYQFFKVTFKQGSRKVWLGSYSEFDLY